MFPLLPAKKSLGQHFLTDANLLSKIAAVAGDVAKCHVIEIGPGPGGLTRALLDAGAKHVYAVEKDSRCVAALQELQAQADRRLTLIEGDALKINLLERVPTPRKIVANLPYNIGTALLVDWLHQIADDSAAYQSLTLMFQKEVVDRITAAPKTKDYGRLSVLCQWLCECVSVFDIPPGAFTPPPKVISSVVRIVPYPKPIYEAELKPLERVLAAGFNQRRKMLRGALKSLSVNVETLLEKADIEGTSRAEELSVEEWCRVARGFK